MIDHFKCCFFPWEKGDSFIFSAVAFAPKGGVTNRRDRSRPPAATLLPRPWDFYGEMRMGSSLGCSLMLGLQHGNMIQWMMIHDGWSIWMLIGMFNMYMGWFHDDFIMISWFRMISWSLNLQLGNAMMMGFDMGIDESSWDLTWCNQHKAVSKQQNSGCTSHIMGQQGWSAKYPSIDGTGQIVV